MLVNFSRGSQTLFQTLRHNEAISTKFAHAEMIEGPEAFRRFENAMRAAIFCIRAVRSSFIRRIVLPAAPVPRLLPPNSRLLPPPPCQEDVSYIKG